MLISLDMSGGRDFHNDPKSVYVLANDDIEKKTFTSSE